MQCAEPKTEIPAKLKEPFRSAPASHAMTHFMSQNPDQLLCGAGAV